MVNELQGDKRISIIKKRMAEVISSITSEITMGNIKTEAELQNIVYHRLNDFYKSIGKSTFNRKVASGLPVKDDHHNMMEQVMNDLYTLFEEVELMTDDIQMKFEQTDMERSSFVQRIKNIEALIVMSKSKINKEARVIIFQEYFSNNDLFEKNNVSGTVANISNENGFLMLNKNKEEDFSKEASITIVEGNGIPGNTHIVRATGGKLKFDGEEEMHTNLAHILDNNLDTWFEYELFSLTRDAKTITQGRNLEYAEGIKWAVDNVDALRCTLKIELEKERKINWISIAPYIPSDRGVSPVTIEKIVISDNKGQSNGIVFEDTFNITKSYIFSQNNIKNITFYFRQGMAYPINVGHFYYKMLELKDVTALQKEYIQTKLRVTGINPSIEHLNASYDIKTGGLLYESVKHNYKIPNEERRKKALFTTSDISAKGVQTLSELEQVRALRYMLGIKGISICNYEFAQRSTYVSVPFKTDDAIVEITIQTLHTIPQEFPEGDWVRYYISIDEGSNWLPISSREYYKEGNKIKYILNTNSPKESRLEEYEYINTKEPVYQVQVKIELYRPKNISDATFYTPIVHHYELSISV